MTSSRTSWKILGALIIVAAIFVAVSFGGSKTPEAEVVNYPNNAASSTGSSTTFSNPAPGSPTYKNLLIACAAPGKDQFMATASSSKRLEWAATPSIDGKIVPDAILEWTMLTPEKKMLGTGTKYLHYTHYVERSSFPAGVTKQTYTMEVKVTIPGGQYLTATCATVDVTLR